MKPSNKCDSMCVGFSPLRASMPHTLRTLVLALSCLLGAPLALSAPPSSAFPEDFNPFAEQSALPQGPAPHIRFATVEHDFGIIAPGSKHEHIFRFVNTGKGLLQIKQAVRSTCGCAVPKLAKSEYGPGEGGELKVIYTATNTPGTSKKNLYVECNDPNQPIVTLTVKVQVVPPIQYSPSQLVLRTKGKEAGCPPILLKSTDDIGFAMLAVMATGNVLSHVCDPNRIARTHTFQPRVNNEHLKSNPHGYLALKLTHPKMRQIRIPYRILPEYQVQPTNLILFNAEPNKPIQRKITVTSNYQESFKIREVRAKNGILPLQASPLPTQAAPPPFTESLSLTLIPPPAPDRSRVDTLTVILENKVVLEIPIRLFYRKAEPTP